MCNDERKGERERESRMSLINTPNTRTRREGLNGVLGGRISWNGIREDGKRGGGSGGKGWDGNTKGYFNSLLSSVARNGKKKK